MYAFSSLSCLFANRVTLPSSEQLAAFEANRINTIKRFLIYTFFTASHCLDTAGRPLPSECVVLSVQQSKENLAFVRNFLNCQGEDNQPPAQSASLPFCQAVLSFDSS